MYRVMIVDDEKFVRKSIINRIEWAERELVLVGEADNGVDALSLVDLVKPDIILVDIKMPLMNGIDLIRAVKKNHSNIHFIILSGYDDFEYTKEAIKLGIANYIKKPIDENELNETFSLIINLLKHQKESEEQIQDFSKQIEKTKALMHEKYLNNLLYNQYNLLTEEGLEFNYKYFGLLLIYVKETSDIAILSESATETINQGILDIQNSMSDSALDHYVFPNPLHPNEIRVLLNGDTLKGKLESISSRLFNTLKEKIPSGKIRSISISVSPVCECPQEIPQMYLQCINQLKHKIIPGQPSILCEVDTTITEATFSEFVYNSINMVKGYMEKRDLQNVNRILQKIFDKRNESKFTISLLESIVLEIHNAIKKSVVKFDMQIQGFSANDLFQPYYLLKFNKISELKNDLITILGQFFGLSNLEEGTLINSIKQYILNHYADNLTLSKIAEEHYLNPSYLSQLFKNKTGENISRFIEDIRVEKAKELLSNISISVVDVAFHVGYNDARYFSKVFKKKTGLLPSVYQEKSTPK